MEKIGVGLESKLIKMILMIRYKRTRNNSKFFRTIRASNYNTILRIR